MVKKKTFPFSSFFCLSSFIFLLTLLIIFFLGDEQILFCVDKKSLKSFEVFFWDLEKRWVLKVRIKIFPMNIFSAYANFLLRFMLRYFCSLNAGPILWLFGGVQNRKRKIETFYSKGHIFELFLGQAVRLSLKKKSKLKWNLTRNYFSASLCIVTETLRRERERGVEKFSKQNLMKIDSDIEIKY